MFCTRCGTDNIPTSQFCRGCGAVVNANAAVAAPPALPVAPADVYAPPQPYVQPYAQPYAPQAPAWGPPAPAAYFEYAGFWKRVAAYMVDGIILSIPMGIVIAVLALVFGATLMTSLQTMNGRDPDPTVLMPLLMGYGLFYIAILVMVWLYFTMQESSRHQATFGKRVMGIIVTDLSGNPITFGRANARFFSKIISGMTMYIGYIMAGFTEKKQCLHDIIASTLVIVKR